MKPCSRCKLSKKLIEFHKQSKAKDGRQRICKSCYKILRRERYINNKEHELQRNKKWLDKNKRRWRDWANGYERDRRANDLEFCLAHRLRSRLRGILSGKIKKGSSVELLGCSIEEFKFYIENQFQEGMTWDNRNTWDIDHIRPLISFDLEDEEQLKQACHYTNLQPMWSKENKSKGGKYAC